MREGGARRARERRAEVGEVGQGEIAGTPGVLRLFPDQSALGNSLWRPGKALFASPTRLQPPPGLPPPSRGQPFQRAVSPLPPRRGPSVLPCPPRSPSAADSRPTNCPQFWGLRTHHTHALTEPTEKTCLFTHSIHSFTHSLTHQMLMEYLL